MHLLLLTLACSVENTLEDKDSVVTGFDSGDSVPDTDDTGDTDGDVPEECNGLDDDGDGLVDEDFPDEDANGRADCEDLSCPAMNLAEAGEVAVEDACTGSTSTDPWSFQVKWAFQTVSDCPECFGTLSIAAVGQLDDDDGDGVIGDADTPDVVVTVNGDGGWIVALDGATGAVKWSYNDHEGFGSVAVVDVDGDGVVEVLAGAYNRVLYALRADGTLAWAAASASTSTYVTPVAADLDGDGFVEVLDDSTIINGEDGSIQGTLDVPLTGMRLAATADVDLDGRTEVALDGRLLESDGSVRWDAGLATNSSMWPFIVQADADDEAEIGFVGATLDVFDTDGTPLSTIAYPAAVTRPGPPCAADLDGDGAVEVAFSSYDLIFAYRLDGTLLWSAPSNDSSGVAGCSVFDVDGDGAYEVLFADQLSFRVFDGATGAERYADAAHESSTGWEFPTVADVDGDGAAEILVVHQGSRDGTLTVYENADGGWPFAPKQWGAHDSSGANYDADGGVPAVPTAWWRDGGVFRGVPSVGFPGKPDLVASITDQCVADCTYGPVEVAVAVENRGGVDVAAGAVLSLYADDGSAERLVRTESLPALSAGSRLDGMQWSLSAADIGAQGWIVRIDEADALRECDETNNEDRWTDSVCP